MTTYFITPCANMQQNLFQRDQVAELMVATFLKYRDTGEFELHEYVVMPNHIHVLLSIHHQQKLSRVIQLIKGGFSHALRENGIIFRAVWEQRYYDRRLSDEDEFAEVSRYIRQNPVRKGLVERAEDYPYSSAARRTVLSGLKPLLHRENAGDANPSASLGQAPKGSLYRSVGSQHEPECPRYLEDQTRMGRRRQVWQHEHEWSGWSS